MEKPAQERRRSKRYRHEMAGGWHPLLVKHPSEQEWRPVFVHNISKGGLCLDIAGPVELADQMDLKALVDITLAPIRCKGAVVRLKPLENPYKTEVGICFTIVDDKDSDLIDALAWAQEQQTRE